MFAADRDFPSLVCSATVAEVGQDKSTFENFRTDESIEQDHPHQNVIPLDSRDESYSNQNADELFSALPRHCLLETGDFFVTGWRRHCLCAWVLHVFPLYKTREVS